jgi:hypothetical protein
MQFHFNKTCNLVMTKIVFKNFEISYTYEVKFLRINFSNNLKRNPHSVLCSKLNKVSYMITSLRDDLLTLRNIYWMKFQSLIRYGIILWGGEIESVRVLKIQKRVLLAIKGLNTRKSCRLIFKELKVLIVTMLYIFEVLCYITKKKPNNIYLWRDLDMCEHNTNKIYLQRNSDMCEHNTGKKFIYKGI